MINLFQEKTYKFGDTQNTPTLTPSQIEDVRNTMRNTFYNFEKETEMLLSAFMTGNYVIFYGDGGYAKSDGTVTFFKTLYNLGLLPQDWSLGVVTMTPDSDTTALVGGINIKAVINGIKDGEENTIFNLAESVLNHDILVVEEAFSSPLLLEQFRDFMTSGRCTFHGLNYPIRTKNFIFCTNENVEQFSEMGASINAFIQRSLFRMEVKWQSHMKEDYYQAIMKQHTKGMGFVNDMILGKEANFSYAEKLANLVSAAAQTSNTKKGASKKPLSPRTVVAVYKAALKYLPTLYNLSPEWDQSVVTELVNTQQILWQEMETLAILTQRAKKLKEIEAAIPTASQKVKEMFIEQMEEMKYTEFYPSFITHQQTINSTIEKFISKCKE